MINPVSIVRRVKNQFVLFDLKSIEGSVPPRTGVCSSSLIFRVSVFLLYSSFFLYLVWD